ncbi:hypothetical protein BV25DRAFT_1869020 [Artomyces pyxidatus]|uniref:Uncharacterized protein n=1 Tax=Artomyces pyxidatus TaxID=48021 RepID=A0ACB8TBD8_9AGAM|nr:hypothetical protein BV25DRAFT_1869020 [Artomyces pyxidatus]
MAHTSPSPPQPAAHKPALPSARTQNAIAHSPLRPHLWTTPWTESWHNDLSSHFTPDSIHRFQEVVLASVEPKTRSNYGAGLLRFTQFCDRHTIPEASRMPASEPLLSLFIAEEGAGLVSRSTVEAWLSGLQLWHAVQGAPWHGGHILRRVKQGAYKLAPASSRLDHMRALRQGLDVSNARDAAIWAAAMVAWAGCCRLGEIFIDSPSTFDSSKHVTRNCSISRGLADNGHHFLKFKIPWSKTKLHAGDTIIITESLHGLDPYSALEHHLFVNEPVPANTISGYAHLTRSDFMLRCNTIWSTTGFSSLTGHSFRIGGTTHLLLSGVDPWVVMAQGRWTSKAFLSYWRKTELILPTFIEAIPMSIRRRRY